MWLVDCRSDGNDAKHRDDQLRHVDDASWVKPAMQIFSDSAQPWVQLRGEMQCFPKMPV
jgi:hypothetical protein